MFVRMSLYLCLITTNVIIIYNIFVKIAVTKLNHSYTYNIILTLVAVNKEHCQYYNLYWKLASADKLTALLLAYILYQQSISH